MPSEMDKNASKYARRNQHNYYFTFLITQETYIYWPGNRQKQQTISKVGGNYQSSFAVIRFRFRFRGINKLLPS